MQMYDNNLGRIEIRTLVLPVYVRRASATYTFSGKVLVDYHREDDPEEKDYIHIAVMNDDGTEFRDIYEGVIRIHQRANGIRFMPYQDNTKVLLGDYVLECSPDIDHCEKSELVPVVYPWNIKQDERVFKHWSEIIIAPDNGHICWTLLRTGGGAAVLYGNLVREENRYSIEKVQIIHTIKGFKKDPDQEGVLVPQIMHGGEVKQFVRGGKAISAVGAKNSVLVDSVIQDLTSEDTIQITKTPCYDETTILSPDEKLGIVMSTRFSPKTNFAILGLMPRPHGNLAAQNMIMTAYLYGVTAVRAYRKGNIGPVLIDIEKSVNEPGYQGVQLSDTEERWVYYSPMSWHPSGKKAMWPEGLRGTAEKRIRIVELPDYKPQEAVPAQQSPQSIPYAETDEDKLWLLPDQNIEGKIAGKHSGYINYSKTNTFARSEYVEMSDDGLSFYNGYEASWNTAAGESVYEADLIMTGRRTGQMKLRLTFSPISFDGSSLPELLLEDAEDGKPKSYGYANYNGTQINVEDLAD